MSNLNTEAYLRAKGLLNDHKIDRDVSCRECGYNLRGLEYGGKCPECGTIIERQLREHAHLMDAPIEYLGKVRLAMWLLCIGVWAPPVAVVVVRQGLGTVATGVALSVQLAGFALFVAGGWLLTAPKPHESVATRPWHHLSKLTRMSLFAPPVIVILAVPFGATAVGAILGFGARFAMFVMYTMLAVVLGDLAKWAKDDRLGQQFDYLSFTIGFFAVVEIAITLFSGRKAYGVCFGSCLVTAVAVWYCISMFQLATIVTRAVADKGIHDASVLRDPTKELK